MNWYGIKVKTTLKFLKLKVKAGEGEIVILQNELEGRTSLLDFFLVYKEFSKLEENEVKSVFGVFEDVNGFVIKKKLKPEFEGKVSLENFIYILEGDNSDAYYTNKHISEKFIGVEIRFKDEINQAINWEDEIIKIQKRVIRGRNEIINTSKK